MNKKRNKKFLFFPEKHRLKIVFKILKIVSYLIIFFLIFLLIIGILLIFEFKSTYQEALDGKNNIEFAVSLAKQNMYKQAYNYAEMSENNFSNCYIKIDKYRNNWIIKSSDLLYSQLNDIAYIFSSAEILSQGIEEGMVFTENIYKIIGDENDFNKLTIDEKKGILQLIYQNTPELNGVKANIDLAIVNIGNIKYQGVLLFVQDKIKNIEIYLKEASTLLENAIPLSQMLPKVLGFPEKSAFLLILQNNDELRPTGGFIGTYGILEVENSDILRLDTHDIYHMDMPVKDKINVEPPAPIKEYLVDKWYMRDANWSPDWSVSAKKIEWFFEQEDALLPQKDQINKFEGEFDGVIAITPQLITDLLALTGPVIIEDEEYNQFNFTNLLEYRVEQGFVELGIPSWHRKEVIGDIIAELKIRIFNMTGSELYQLYHIVNENLKRKNVLVYFNDEGFEELVKERNWSGEIKQTPYDYLMVVDANLGAYKTDAVMNRQITYSIDSSAGGMFSKLRINYSNNGEYDWRTTKYRTYTRVYVPLGSELIKANGYTDGNVDVYIENGKTVFGSFIDIEPGKIGSLYFEYKLPKRLELIRNRGGYGLYVQKQPGRNVELLNIDMNHNDDIKSYWPTGFFVKKNGERSIEWETDLFTDKEFIVTF